MADEQKQSMQDAASTASGGGAPHDRGDIQRIQPESLLRTFTRTNLLLCLAAAIGLHVLLIGGTGYSTVLDLVDPQRVVEREKRAAEAKAEAQRRALEQAEARMGAAAGAEDADGSAEDGDQAETPGQTGEGGAADAGQPAGGASNEGDGGGDDVLLPPSGDDVFDGVNFDAP